jgi:hypothetical protein
MERGALGAAAKTLMLVCGTREVKPPPRPGARRGHESTVLSARCVTLVTGVRTRTLLAAATVAHATVMSTG